MQGVARAEAGRGKTDGIAARPRGALMTRLEIVNIGVILGRIRENLSNDAF